MSGTTPRNDAPSRGPAVLAVSATVIALSTAFVFFRLVSRAGIVKHVTLDDYFIIIAWILAFGMTFSVCYATQFGLGQHEYDIADSERMPLAKLQYVFTVLYNPAIVCTKTSIGIFYLSLCKGTHRVFKWGTVGTMTIVIVAGTALTLLCLFQCRPLNALFAQPRPADAHCIDIVTLYLSSAPVNIATDIFLLLLPMPLLKSMRLPKKQKIILYITFGFGIFVAVVDVVRISYLQQASITRLREIQGGQASDAQQAQIISDFSWYASLTFLWSAIEVNVGIMCACVPALKPLVSRFMPHILKDTVTSHETEKRPSHVSSDSMDHDRNERCPSPPISPLTAAFPPLPHHRDQPPDSEPMGIMDFLTTPDMAHLQRSDTVMTNPTDTIRRGSTPTFFDFVNMGAQKNILQHSNKESVRPIVEVTLLFFLWGFAYGLLGTLNSQFQLVAHMTPGETTAIHSIYYAGYAVGPLSFGRVVLKKWGFKACYIVGLIIYGTGTLVFWPAGVLSSFPAFLVSNFITGLGLSILELGANPFITLIGPPQYGEIRLNLSQGIQAIGTVISPLIAKKALFKNDILDSPSLIDTQWTYLAISIFTFFLGFIYYIIKLPEVTDDQLEESAWETHLDSLDTLRRKKVVWTTLGVCVFGQFIYVGVQETVSTSLSDYLAETSVGANAVNWEAIGHSLFAFSRLSAAAIGFIVKPRFLLFFCFAGALVFSILATKVTGTPGCVIVMMIYFFEGPLFPLLFSIPLRAQGKYTKDASAYLTAAISGGAVFSPILQAVARSHTYRYSFCVVISVFAAGMLAPIYLNVYGLAARQVDPVERSGRRRDYSVATTAALRKVSQVNRRRTWSGKSTADATSTEVDLRDSGVTGKETTVS